MHRATLVLSHLVPSEVAGTAFGLDLLKEDPAGKKLSDFVPVKQSKDLAKDSKDKDGPKSASSGKSAAAASKKEEPRTIKSPLQTLRKWWQDASRRPFVLSTVRLEGKEHLPDSRTIQLLDMDDSLCFYFYTRIGSAKVTQISSNANFSGVALWTSSASPNDLRQVRMWGKVVKTDDAASDRLWRLLPRQSQVGYLTFATPPEQGSPKSLDAQISRVHKVAERHENVNIAIPREASTSCAYRLVPHMIELYEGFFPYSSRVRFTLQQGEWTAVRMDP
jgi:pyridoxine/pyridoxamine 5'-phosphate oxidase